MCALQDGQQLSIDGISEAVDVFQVMQIAQKKIKAVRELQDIGVPSSTVAGWLKPDPDASGGAEGVRYDMRSNAPLWLNDLENDDDTAEWSPSLQTLLEPSYQMQIYIRKNMFSALVFVDPGSAAGLFTLSIIDDNLKQKVPIRIGLVLLQGPVKTREEQWAGWVSEKAGAASTENSVATDADINLSPLITRAFHFIVKKRNAKLAVGWAKSLYDACEEAPMGEMDQQMMMMMMMQGGGQMARMRSPPSEDLVKESLHDFVTKYKVKGTYKTDEMFAEFYSRLQTTDKFDTQLAEAEAMTESLSVTQLPSMFVNGQLYAGEPEIVRQLPYTLREQYPVLVEEVRSGRLTDDDVILDYFSTQPDSRKRIPPEFESPENWAKTWMPTLVKKVPHSDVHYIYPAAASKTAMITTVWAAVDVDTTPGLQLLTALLQSVSASENLRAAVFFNVATAPEPSKQAVILKQLLQCSNAAGADRAQVFQATETILFQAMQAGAKDLDLSEISEVASTCLGKAALAEAKKAVGQDAAFCSQEFSAEPGKSALLVHGDWKIPKKSAPVFEADIVSLANSEPRAARAFDLLKGLEQFKEWAAAGDGMLVADKIAAVTALLPASGNVFQLPTDLAGEHTIVRGGDSASALLNVAAVLNPLTTQAQQVSTIIHVLSKALGEHLAFEIVLLPELESGNEGKLPLDKYYRYVLGGESTFDEEGASTVGTTALFKQLPTGPTLTLGMHTLNSWMIGPESARYDLDNIVLADLKKASTLHAEWAMRHLLVQGSVLSHTNTTEGTYDLEGAASGLELMLGPSVEQPNVADTVVMENVGYFQLKASPGIWHLHIASSNYEFNETLTDQLGGLPVSYLDGKKKSIRSNSVTVRDWTGSNEQLRVLRVGDKDQYEQMMANGGGWFGNLMGGMNNLMSGDKNADDKPATAVEMVDDAGEYDPNKDPNCIHIFSLASGHSYERFLKIMIQSLLSQTKSKVKFWLLENFASPQFKDFLPIMAEEYGFYFEFVTYNWPHWLRRQTQKQRVMWGYKILFLDVLFPLDVKRIIFVDADQILRADVKELWEIDLGDAPYGYTPMCSSNKELEGFMFWNQGFWVEHLQGKPYHISALYVVDLERFRLTRVGDRLRGVYDQLSRDPNSLANLDQDLPNYAQHQVPIFSLPQEWLWCESWCSAETKATAKTIDMCNNPQKKTPKIEMAKRIASGPLFPVSWADFDERVTELETRVSQQQ